MITQNVGMFYLVESSLCTENPVFQTLDSNGLLFPEKTIAYDFAYRGVYERSLIDWAASLMDPSKNFVDIGAHVGTWSLPFAKRSHHVYSFECTPRTYNILCGNIALRGFDTKITAERIALGSSAGDLEFHIVNEDGGGNTHLDYLGGSKIVVRMRTLDSFDLTNIGMIKIDVEGMEIDVLRGMTETLERNGYPRILFESWNETTNGIPAKAMREELFTYVNSLGYKIHSITGFPDMFLAEH